MTTLQKTIIGVSGHKFEIYSSKGGIVDRVIEYRMKTLESKQGFNGGHESQWFVYNPNVDLKGRFFSGEGVPSPGQEPNCVDNVAIYFSKK
ncbi:TPA: hypothetical protein JHW84_003174 [Escherichia coli]|nr:hypothetical protein [Escherichia coli]